MQSGAHYISISCPLQHFFRITVFFLCNPYSSLHNIKPLDILCNKVGALILQVSFSHGSFWPHHIPHIALLVFSCTFVLGISAAHQWNHTCPVLELGDRKCAWLCQKRRANSISSHAILSATSSCRDLEFVGLYTLVQSHQKILHILIIAILGVNFTNPCNTSGISSCIITW